MAKMLQSGIGRAVLATVEIVVAVVATTSRAARAARSASRLAVFAIAAAAAVFAALALDRADADAQAGSVKSLSVGGDHACALTTTDAIICWGRNDAGQTDAPTRHGSTVIELGEDYSCGTSNDVYKVSVQYAIPWICWGSEDRMTDVRSAYGNCTSKGGRGDICSGYTINGARDTEGFSWYPEAVGITHRCGWSQHTRRTHRHGSRNSEHWHQASHCRGSNAFGQLDIDHWEGFVVGGWHTCRLNNDSGSIQCVGRNDSGQTDVPSGQYLSVDAGREHTCAVTSASRLRCWGEDALGQSSPPGGSDYLEVSSNAFANFNCALTDERKVRCWGDNRYGQTNVPAAIAAPPPLQFTQPVEAIITRKNQPISPLVLPPASGGKGRLSYNIAHTKGDTRKKGTPTGLVFDETTRQLSGRPFDDAGWITLHYSVSDTSGRTEAVDITLNITGPVPAGYPPAITTPELGTLNRGLIRCGVWSEESRTFSGGAFDTYAFRIASPTQLSINLESEDADTYASLSGSGETWRDDDGGQGTNSRITAGLAPARYWLHVYTADGRGEGAYTLRITSPDFIIGNADASASCPSGRTGQGSTSSSSEGTLDSATAGRIAARRIANGSIEFAWQVEGGDRILPRSRYLPADPPTGRWLNSSAIVVEGVDLGRINVRVNADTGRVEFAFTPAGGERILPPSRYFPSSAEAGVWLQSTIIEPGG